MLLLTGQRNEPLGLRNAPARTSAGSLPVQPVQSRRPSHQSQHAAGKKTTADGAIILEPQPEESHNDPLNWPKWRRDVALLSLGFYCMVGGGMTPILAAGFSNVASTYHTTVPRVALTTGLYMMGLGVGSVIFSPTAILYGKRPVYLFGALLFIGTSAWCAASPSYASLVVARVLQGIAVSPVECLPSATIAEIFFLHERAYRIGVYTLLLLGGKNVIPLVSAAIIQSMGWRWVFWYVGPLLSCSLTLTYSRIVTMVVGFCLALLFLFVPESFWDRNPVPKNRKTSRFSLFGSRQNSHKVEAKKPEKEPNQMDGTKDDDGDQEKSDIPAINSTLPQRPSIIHRTSLTQKLHVGFVPSVKQDNFDESKDSNLSEDTLHPSRGKLK